MKRPPSLFVFLCESHQAVGHIGPDIYHVLRANLDGETVKTFHPGLIGEEQPCLFNQMSNPPF